MIYIVKISDANISVIKNVNDFKEVILQNSKDIRIIDLRDTSNGKGNAHHQAEQFMMNINMKLLIWDAAN